MMGPCTGYLAAPGFVREVVDEVGEVVAVHDRLVLAAGPPRASAWAQNVWFDPVCTPIDSIRGAVRTLRAVQRDWALYSHAFHRRAALIAAELPKLRVAPITFGTPAPTRPLGSWTLLDANTLLAAARCSCPFPHGEVEFSEDKHAPPNRAYLKLWELFTLTGEKPQPGERCLDLGASPGGWTWVLATLGARVFAVDKAPLAPSVAALPNVEFESGSAFGVDPAHFAAERGELDWLFCDVACYPERLLTLVLRWIAVGAARRMVCTIKFQGATDHEMVRRFTAIPRGRVVHLWHNKHELTWTWSR